jgi:hypothetical protein
MFFEYKNINNNVLKIVKFNIIKNITKNGNLQFTIYGKNVNILIIFK